MTDLIEVLNESVPYAGAIGCFVVSAYTLTLGIRTVSPQARRLREECKKREDPNSGFWERALGVGGYRPLYEGDPMVKRVSGIKKHKDGKSVWNTSYIISNTALRDVYGARI